MPVVIGLDPGFAKTGVAVIDVHMGGDRLILLDVLRTQKSKVKTEVRASDDKVRRAQEMASALESLIRTHHPVAIAAEAMSFGMRNGGTQILIGIAWGVMAAVATMDAMQIPIVQASPMQIKRVLCGNSKATKEEVIAAVQVKFPDAKWPKVRGLWEHAADAVGAIYACRDSGVIQMARRLALPPNVNGTLPREVV